MPTWHQATTEKVPADQGKTLKGPPPSDPAHLAEIFPAGSDKNSPYKIPTPAEVQQMGKDLLQSAIVNDGGHVFGTFNRDYVDAPEFADVKTGPGGLPATAQSPNVATPGPGNTNPLDMPAPPIPFKGAGHPFPRGDASISPAHFSAETAKQTLGELIWGQSSKNSDIGKQ